MVERWILGGNDYEQFMETDDRGQYVLHSDYAALEARLAELEKDAARYRWLRDGGINELPIVARNGEEFMSTGSYLDGDVDVLIAMNEA